MAYGGMNLRDSVLAAYMVGLGLFLALMLTSPMGTRIEFAGMANIFFVGLAGLFWWNIFRT